ncbi:MAG: hypothetical protein AAF585_24265 [Verrucomicrobiota bacterium]
MADPYFDNLLSQLIDGDLPPERYAEFAEWLQASPERAEATRAELEFADLLEQSLKPERQFPAFLDGLEERVRAERTADEFIATLLPKLKAVDERKAKKATIAAAAEESGKVVPFPFYRRAVASLAAAAALGGLMAIPLLFTHKAEAMAMVGMTENAVWEETSEPIEWEVGTPLMAGTPVRLRAGKARIDFRNGNRVTIEGPADFSIVSDSIAELRAGKAVASDVPENADPFLIQTRDDVEVEVNNGSAGIQIHHDRVEATRLSIGGEAVLRSAGNVDEMQIGQSVYFERENGIGHAAFDIGVFHDHLPLLTGVESYSDPVHFTLPTSAMKGEAAPPGEMQVTIERDNLQLPAGMSVDLVPGTEFDFGPENPAERPKLTTGSNVRSYLLQMESLQVAPARDDQVYINGYIKFDRPILAISTTGSTLYSSDGLTGHNGRATLSAQGFAPTERGLEEGDVIQILDDGKTLGFRVKAAERSKLAQLRVFVEMQK